MILIRRYNLQKDRILTLSNQLQIAERNTQIPYYSTIILSRSPYEYPEWPYEQLQHKFVSKRHKDT